MGGVVKAITNIVKAVVKVVVDVVKAVINFVGDVVGFVVNPFGVLTPDMPTIDTGGFGGSTAQDPGQSAQGVTITKSGTNVAIPIVYGHRRVGGSIIFAETSGDTNKHLYVVYAIAEGPIHGVGKMFINDEQLPLPASGNVYTMNNTVNNVTQGRFADRVSFSIFSGSDSQAQSSLANEAPSWSTKSRTMPGLAYAVFKYTWLPIETQEDADANPFSGGIPSIKFDVFGKEVYDVRTHGSSVELSTDYANLSKSYQFNPASCLLDYLMNPRYGMALPKEEIDALSFKIAANKYEQNVSYSNNQSGRAMTMNAVIDSGATLFDNVKRLVSGCRGMLPYVQGRYKLKVEDAGNETDITSTTINIAFDVTKDNILGGISLQGEKKTTKYNQVIVNYIDPDLNFTNQQVVYRADGDQTIDNDEELSSEFTFHTLNNKNLALDIARMIYDKSRRQKSINFTASQELLNVEIGDVIRVTDSILDLSNDTFRVVGLKLRNDGFIDIEAFQHDATIYPFVTGPQIDIPPPIFLPDEIHIGPKTSNTTHSNGPTQVVPIVDPDAADTGQGGGTSESPNPPPIVQDTVATNIVTKFEDHEASANIFTASGITTVYEYGDLFQYSTWGYSATELKQGSDRCLQYRPVGGTGFNYAGVASYNGITNFLMYMSAPLDTSVYDGKIEYYDNQQLVKEQWLRIRNNAIFFNGSKLDANLGIYHHRKFYFDSAPSINGVRRTDLTIKFRWYKMLDNGSEKQYEDASLIGNGSDGSFTYRNYAGVSVTNNNLESLLNKMVLYNDQNTSLTKSSASAGVNLGA